MSTNNKYKKAILIITASAIMWVFLASIINFHMQRIWGKQLVEQTYTIIKPKDKKQQLHVLISSHKAQNFHLFLFAGLFIALTISLTGFLINWKKLFYPVYLYFLRIADFPDQRNFRGPPSL